MSREQKPRNTRRPPVENGGLALFLGLFVVLWAVLPSATGIAWTKWSVIALCAVVGWQLRRELKAALPTKKQSPSSGANGSPPFPEIASAATPFTNGSQPVIDGNAHTTATPGPHRENAPDGGAVTEPRSGEDQEAQRP